MRPGASKLSTPANESKEIFVGQAASILKVSRNTVERLCEEGTLRARRFPDRGWWRIERDSVVEHRERVAREVTARVAASILGISRVDVLELCRKGSLRARLLGGVGRYKIERDSVVKYRDRSENH